MELIKYQGAPNVVLETGAKKLDRCNIKLSEEASRARISICFLFINVSCHLSVEIHLRQLLY